VKHTVIGAYMLPAISFL